MKDIKENEFLELKDEELSEVAGGANTECNEVYIEPSECLTCGYCEGECPCNAIYFAKDTYIINSDRCTRCGICVSKCAMEAIKMR